jgi:glycosyltransferase involved in cell wall biosynthesis
MGTIVEAARILLPHKDILFLLVGDGVQKEDVEQRAERLQLTNMKFVPMQPWRNYPPVLHASDVSLVTLRKEVTTPVVPSKLLSIMASGRPVVASLPLDGDAPKIVEAAKCGYCVEAGNAEAMAQAILRIHDDPSLAKELGNNGRRYAERHFARRVCVKRYETLFRNAVEEKSAFATTSRQEAGPTQRTTKPL